MIDEQPDDYDSPWKEAVEHYFPEFMAFYFPAAHAEIDWSQDYVFLDQELRAVVQDAELGKRFVDKLVRGSLRNGDSHWIYIHIEVQGTRQAEFPERMFVYNYRLYDRYRRPIASLAVLADPHENWRPHRFGYGVLGSETSIRFPIAKLTDYQEKLDDLLSNDNPFALITAAHGLTRQTRNNDQARYEAKRHLVRLLYRRQWDKQRIIDLFAVIDWMMRLPAFLARQLHLDIHEIEEQTHMRYVTTIERFGIEQGESRLLRTLLEYRFGILPTWVTNKLNNADTQTLEAWGKAILTAPKLEDVFDQEDMH